jgi:Tfp pilus assembly protein PilF
MVEELLDPVDHTRMKRLMSLPIFFVMVFAGMTACTKSSQQRGQQAIERGKQRLEQKDYARAVLEFKNAIQATPKDAEAHYQLGIAMLAEGDISGGYASLRNAVGLDPAHAAAQIKIAELHTVANQPETLEDAAKRMEGVLASKPGDTDALSALAFTEVKLGDVARAEEHLARAVESGPRNVKAAVGLAAVKFSQGKATEAEQILRRVAAQNPPSALGYLVMGEFYLRTNKLPEGKREFERALQIDNQNVFALLYLGNLHLRAGQAAEAEAVYKKAAALPDKRYRSIHAVYLLQTGKTDEALKEFEQLVAADATDRPTRRRLVSAYLSLRRTADAERILADVLKKNGKDTDALLQRSAILLTTGKLVEAYNALRQVLDFEPNSAEAHLLMARAQAARGNPGSAKEALAEAVRVGPNLLPPRLEYARLLRSGGSAKVALEVLDQAPDWHKRNAAFVAERNWTLALLGKKDEMRSAVEAALRSVRTPDLLLQDAVLKMQSGNMAAGRKVIEEMLKQWPEDTRALDVLARSYVIQGQVAAAEKKLREHISSHPKSAHLQQFLGAWLIQNGGRTEARAAFEAAKAADSSFWSAEVALAALDATENKTDSVRNRLQHLVSNPRAEVEARILLADAEYKAGNYSTAIEHYRKVIALQPDNLLVLNNLAYMLLDRAQSPDEALKFAERAKELAPDNALIDDTIGWILYRKGLYARAVQHLESAVKREANATRHAHLALGYAARGDKNRGFEQLQAAVKLNPALPEVAAAQQALAAAR